MSGVEYLKQGAEGKLYLGDYNGQKCLIKERFVKNYRHPDLDKQLTRQRIKAEQKAVQRCESAGVLTPKFYNVDIVNRKIFMEYLDKSMTAKMYIDNLLSEADNEDKVRKLGIEIGRIIGKMHSNNIIHGDLTTSNILLDPLENGLHNVIMIDFGLSHYSDNSENKGVDLYVLERALLSTHSQFPEFFNIILGSYKENSHKKCDEIICKFEEVRARGRKRTMVG